MKKTISAIICTLLLSTMTFAQKVPEQLQSQEQLQGPEQPKAQEQPQKQDFQYTGVSRPYRNEITLSFGYVSFPNIKHSVETRLTAILMLPQGNALDDTYTSGTFSIEYMRYTKNGRFAFGGVLSFEHLNSRYVSLADSEEETLLESLSFMTLLPSAKVIWLHRKHIGFYTHLAAGLISETNDFRNVGFSFQFTPIGMDFGWEHFRAFFQMGFGDIGLVQAGIKTCF